MTTNLKESDHEAVEDFGNEDLGREEVHTRQTGAATGLPEETACSHLAPASVQRCI